MIRIALAVVLLLGASSSPAAAWNPYWDDWWWEEPIVSYEPDAVSWHEPEASDIWWWQDAAWEPAPPSPPAPVVPVAPEGIYYVTEVYVADVVRVSGPVTTYSTVTASDTPGTYARVAETVGTGSSSSYDGTAFNGRATLDDGRPVAGTYYENFILSNGSFVPVSVVFFQDDSVVAPVAPPAPTPAPPPAPTPAPPSPPTPAPPRPSPTPAPAAPPAPPAPPAPTPAPHAWVAPVVESTPAWTPPPAPSAPPAPRVPVLRPGVADSPLGEPAFSLEVLRGRAVSVWFRALADGVAVPVSSWRISAGEHTALGSVAGGRDDPFRGRWDVVTPPGGAWLLRVEATVVIDGVSHPTSGDIAVVVRSPALVR